MYGQFQSPDPSPFIHLACPDSSQPTQKKIIDELTIVVYAGFGEWFDVKE
jgi:hypothetical protein